MTADAQPRKRKDKRKNKKGDEEVVAPPGMAKGQPHSPTPPPQQSGDTEVMHIYKESFVGGNVATKVVFFVLMSGLVALVTLSIVQLREPPQAAEIDVSHAEVVEEVSWSEWFLDPSSLLSFGMWEEVEEHDLFPEAKEALRLEREQVTKKPVEQADIVEDFDDSMLEEPEEPEETPEDAGEEEAEGKQEAAAARNEATPRPPQSSEVKKEVKKEPEVVKQEAPRPQAQAPPRAAPPSLPKPPPPSLTPPPSDDEEQLSDNMDATYSDEEKVEEEEEIEDLEEVSNPSEVEEEEEIDEVVGGSDDEEVEEESEEEEPPPPPPKRKPQSTGRPRGGPQAFENDDWAIKEELDMIDEEFNRLQVVPKVAEKDVPASCAAKYDRVLKKWTKSGRAAAAVAACIDVAAEKARSNNLLDKAIAAYTSSLDLQWTDDLFLLTANTTITRIRFRGKMWLAVDIHKKIIQRFPDVYSHRNDLAVTFLMQNRLDEALDVFHKVMTKWPGEAFATSHYGLALKLKGKLAEAVPFLEQGISNDSIKDARLYFHLGDALMRLGRSPEEVYKRGAKLGLFKSKDQRSLYNVDRLQSQPFWDPFSTPYASFFKKLQDNWRAIRDEAKAAMKLNHQGFRDEAENLRDKGDWKQFEMFSRGIENRENCKAMPLTCKLVASEVAARTCTRGQTKLSIMSGGTHVWPHCGPTNCRLRAHLGLIVPPGPAIRVANITKKWEEGNWIMFDDSFEHEVWHNGTLPRLVLIVDVWHPELTPAERRTLKPI